MQCRYRGRGDLGRIANRVRGRWFYKRGFEATLRSFVFDIGQECRHHSEQRQIGANSIHEFDAVLIRKAAQDGGADAADTESETKEQS
jgi:hypothetical protein